MASYNLPESVSEGQTGHLTHTGKIHDIVNKFHYDQVESPGVVPVWDGTAYGPAHPIVTTFYDGVQNLVVPADWNGTLQRFRGGPNTITIQTEAVLNLPIGFAFSVLMWSGSGLPLPWPSTMWTSSAPPSKSPATTAFTSPVR